MTNMLHYLTRGIQPSSEDVRLLSELLDAEGGILPAQASRQEEALDILVHKPWGYEYRIYTDAFYDLWHLCLHPGESTSLHCHPRKGTALICLGGEGMMHLLGYQQHIQARSCLHLDKGVFHATENCGTTDLNLIEVEVPRQKLDLLRAKDRYGRAGQGYEREEPSASQDAVPPMQPALHRSGARMRLSSLHHRYQFAIMSGHEIARHPEAQQWLCISLSIAAALQQTIEVVAGIQPLAAPSESYLTIAPIREERETTYA